MNMKTNNAKARKIMKLIGFILSAIVTALGFSYLYTRGVSPVWAAVAIVCFPGFFRFIYKIASILIAGLIIFAIISLLVF
jgi:heme/copper-type cytochrome/quinol oxidase subunit 4